MFCNRICNTAGDCCRTGLVPSKPFTYLGFFLCQTRLSLFLDRKLFVLALLSPSLELHSFNNPDSWLHRHDFGSRYLHGLVCLIEGMPAVMVDHFCRCVVMRMLFATSLWHNFIVVAQLVLTGSCRRSYQLSFETL